MKIFELIYILIFSYIQLHKIQDVTKKTLTIYGPITEWNGCLRYFNNFLKNEVKKTTKFFIVAVTVTKHRMF